MIKGVLLDVDGTLVLSNDAHAESWAEAFKHFGYDIGFDEVRPLIGMGGDKLMPRLRSELDDESGIGKEIGDFRTKLFLKKYAPKLKPAAGSRKFVKKLKDDGFKLVVASSAKTSEIGTLLKAAQVDDLLEEKTTASDAENSKPDPDVVHAALEKIGIASEELLMIGDTPYDIEAAERAGVETVAVRCGGWKDKDLEDAIVIYDDPADILANYDSSPFGKNAKLFIHSD